MTPIDTTSRLRVGLIGTYPPRECGIATFTDDLAHAIRHARRHTDTAIVAVADVTGGHAYEAPVEYQIRHGLKGDYIHAADYVNYSDISVVSLQHEYGIYGGVDGVYVLDFIAHLAKPLIVTLHTVLQHPTESQRTIVRTIADRCQRLVVMSERAVDLLRESYGVSADRVTVIPHGIPDVPADEQDKQKTRFGLQDRRVILTFGLLSPGKGVETVIRALPSIIERFPDIIYMVVGATHPDVKRREGEGYRHSLEALAESLGVRNHVVLRNQFVDRDELIRYLQAADFLVTPYLHEAQITSGVLAYAMGAGVAPLSTPFWYAQELIADGRGRLFPFDDSEALAETTISLLSNPAELRQVQRAAFDYSRQMTWPRVGATYAQLFEDVLHAVPAASPLERATRETTLPELKLDHLLRLSDDTGIIQHARYTVPRRSSGYCVDDNARALVVALHVHDLTPSRETDRLITTCLAFLEHAQEPDGAFHNFMSYERVIDVSPPSQDCIGRALWSLGEASHLAPDQGRRQLATELFNRTMSQPLEFGPRGAASSILGLDAYLTAYPDEQVAKTILASLAGSLVERFTQEAQEGWQWFEPTLTYDNGFLPLALFKAYGRLGDPECLRIARLSLGFLEEVCLENDYLSLVGNAGWHSKGGNKPCADEQPLDAASLVLAFRSAYIATGNHRDVQRMRQAFEWFLGANRLGQPLYDFSTAGCRDGLGIHSANENQGAESTVSFLIALLAMQNVVSEIPGSTEAGRMIDGARGIVESKPSPTTAIATV